MSKQSNQLRHEQDIDSIQQTLKQGNNSQNDINLKDQTQNGQEQFKNHQVIESIMNQQLQQNKEFENYLSSLGNEIFKLIQQLQTLSNDKNLQQFIMLQAQQTIKELSFPNFKFENKINELQTSMKDISDKYIQDLKKLIEQAQSYNREDIIYSQSQQVFQGKDNYLNIIDDKNKRENNENLIHQKDEQQQEQTNNDELEQNVQFNENSYSIKQNQEQINYVNQLIVQAETLKKDGKFEESMNYYNKALAIDEKKNIICWRGKGDCLRKLQCFVEAIQCYDKALNIKKNDIPSLLGKGECLTMLEKYQESKLVYQEVLKLDDKNIASHFGLGECLRLQGSFKEAIEQYNLALNIDQKNVASIQGKGYCLQHIHEYKLASECYRQVLNMNPQNQVAKRDYDFCVKELSKTQLSKNSLIKSNNLEENQNLFYTEDLCNGGKNKIPHIKQLKQSNTQLEQQNINFDAVKSFSVMPNQIQNLVILRSESFDNRKLLETMNEADDLKKNGQYSKAIQLYDKVLEKDPYHIPSLNGKGNCLRLMLKFEESITFLDRALKLNKNSTSLYGKGECLRMLNQFEEARKCYEESLKMCQEEQKDQDPLNPLLYMNLRGLGDILRVRAEFQDSIQFYDQALSINQDHVLSLFGKAESLRGQAKYKESIIYYERSLKLNQNHIMSLSGIGESLRMSKQYREAQKYYEKALKIDKDGIINLRGLSECLRHQNDLKKALEYVEQALNINPFHEKCLNSKNACLKDLEKQKAALKQKKNFCQINNNENKKLNLDN